MKSKKWLPLLVILLFSLAACGGQSVAEATQQASQGSAEEPLAKNAESTAVAETEPQTEAEPIDPNAIFTSAVETVAAQMTQTAMAFSPTPAQPAATATFLPTATLIDLNLTPSATPIGGLASATPLGGVLPTATLFGTLPTSTPSPVPSPSGAICDAMVYGDPLDVTYADGTIVPAGERFVKIWRVQNTGVCDWDEGYYLVSVSSSAQKKNGETIDNTNPLNVINPAWEVSKIGDIIEPQEIIDIRVSLTAPTIPGIYSTCFILVNDRDVYFGGLLCVEIEVAE